MNVKLNVLFTISFFEHSVVENIRNLRYLTWSVHNWNILLDPQRPLWWRSGLMDHRLHCDRISPEVLRLQGLINDPRTPNWCWLLGTGSPTPAIHYVTGDGIQVSDSVQYLLNRRYSSGGGCCSRGIRVAHQASEVTIPLTGLLVRA
jgi:hypothetical protein